jgi:hypothetical protein
MTQFIRGTTLHLTRQEVLARAYANMLVVPEPQAGSPSDAGSHPIGYRLTGGFNGGNDPTAPYCYSWSYGGRRPTADCIGFVLHSSGIDRLQPHYNGVVGEWLHCGSLLADAYGTGLPKGTAPHQFCRSLGEHEAVLPGDWMLTRDHIALVLRPETADSGVLVMDCSPRHGRNTGIGIGYAWSEACEVVRPLFYKEAV